MSKKPLFNTSDLNMNDNSLKSSIAAGDVVRSINYSGKAKDFVKELDHLLTIKAGHIDFMTSGVLSLHTMIELIIKKFGPCMELYISTWAIKEAAARSLYLLVKAKQIGSLHGIFDYRIKSRDRQNFILVENLFFRYELTKNHSKVVLIEYKDLYITILSSANMSNNPRIEAGLISLSQKTFMFHKSWMLQVFDGKKVY